MKIYLFCAGGMSTGLLVKNMEKYILEKGLDHTVSAHGIGSVEYYCKDADIILLGPQIRYKLNQVKEIVKDKPVMVIDTKIYGMLDGKKLMEEIIKLMED
ncbi:MAG: PTS sugar transporter subunit IIB [Firmicutes bacterium]|nr:PTS sugar transporter subunit IIB [Bacillota bacterium]